MSQISTIDNNGQLIPHNIEEKVSTTKIKLDNLLLNIKEAEIADRVSLIYKSLKDATISTKDLEDRLINLHSLKNKAIDAESSSLQTIVDSINTIVSDIVTSLFDDPITITLQLYKQMKTTKRIKPVVNLVINYKGGEFDRVDQLSGGEADRVSLALTLALNKLSGSPFLILDESLSSLDGNVKELCLSSIRHNAGDKMVICVNHESVEGHYDSVIRL